MKKNGDDRGYIDVKCFSAGAADKSPALVKGAGSAAAPGLSPVAGGGAWAGNLDGVADTSWLSYDQWGRFLLDRGTYVLEVTNKTGTTIEKVCITNDLSFRPAGHMNILAGWRAANRADFRPPARLSHQPPHFKLFIQWLFLPASARAISALQSQTLRTSEPGESRACATRDNKPRAVSVGQIMKTVATNRAAPNQELILGDRAAFVENFNQHPFAFEHRLTDHPLLQLPRVAELVRSLPRGNFYFDAGDIAIGQRWDQSPRGQWPVAELVERIENCASIYHCQARARRS